MCPLCLHWTEVNVILSSEIWKSKKRPRLLLNHVFTLQWLNVDGGQLTTSFLADSLPLPASVKDGASFTIALNVPIRTAHCWSVPPPSTTLGYRQVMSAKLNFLRYLTWWRLKHYYWLQYAWKTDTVMENLQPLDWINSFVTVTKLAPHSFRGFPHKFST